MSDILRSQKTILNILLIAVSLLIVVVVGNVVAQQINRDNYDRLDRLRRYQADLDHLLATVGDAETGQRGYLLTGDPNYLEPYHLATSRTDQLLEDIGPTEYDALFEGNERQRLGGLVKRKYDELAETIRLYNAGQRAEALALVNSEIGRRYMDTLRTIIADINERSIIMQEQTQLKITQTDRLQTISQLFLILVLPFFFYLIYVRIKPLLTGMVKMHSTLETTGSQLRKKNLELEHFAYIASHDLQEPLRTVHSFVEILREEYDRGNRTEMERYFAIINTAVDRMGLMIKGLLRYSRIGQSGVFRNIDLNSLLNQLQLRLLTRIEETHTQIRYRDLPTVVGLHTELTQLFQNLIINSIKFRHPERNPIIEISATYHAEFWHVKVQDNGIGIPETQHDYIFNMFARLKTDKSAEAGQGLGLSFCRKIVELHNGTIWVESIENEGSTFHFTLTSNLPVNQEPQSEE